MNGLQRVRPNDVVKVNAVAMNNTGDAPAVKTASAQ